MTAQISFEDQVAIVTGGGTRPGARLLAWTSPKRGARAWWSTTLRAGHDDPAGGRSSTRSSRRAARPSPAWPTSSSVEGGCRDRRDGNSRPSDVSNGGSSSNAGIMRKPLPRGHGDRALRTTSSPVKPCAGAFLLARAAWAATCAKTNGAAGAHQLGGGPVRTPQLLQLRGLEGRRLRPVAAPPGDRKPAPTG